MLGAMKDRYRIGVLRFPAWALAALLAGCTSDDGGRPGPDLRLDVTRAESARVQTANLVPSPDGTTRQAGPMLAYEHNVTVELDRERLLPRVQALQAACLADREFSCTLLDVSTSSREDMPSGTVRVRLAPAGTQNFIDMAAKDGRVADRNTHAEDLAEPVADTERRLLQLTTHRDRLDEFMKRRDMGIDPLITVSRELASVQAQIDELNNQHTNLRRRIDTELLTINLVLPAYAYEREPHPIRDALHSFGNDFTRAIAQVIRFIAGLLPWLVVIVPGLILLRLFWRRVGRWLARREQSAR